MKGQAKKDFEKWLLINDKEDFLYEYNLFNNPTDVERIELFKYMSPSMQYGVIVDWFDSVGIYIEILRTPKGYSEFVNTLSDNVWSKTRTQARQKAIEKAQEIYNNRV